jgi:hypothetical protein
MKTIVSVLLCLVFAAPAPLGADPHGVTHLKGIVNKKSYLVAGNRMFLPGHFVILIITIAAVSFSSVSVHQSPVWLKVWRSPNRPSNTTGYRFRYSVKYSATFFPPTYTSHRSCP